MDLRTFAGLMIREGSIDVWWTQSAVCSKIVRMRTSYVQPGPSATRAFLGATGKTLGSSLGAWRNERVSNEGLNRPSPLDRMVLIGEPSLERATAEFAIHYHGERNHQGVKNKII
jgi:hypothetical protein